MFSWCVCVMFFAGYVRGVVCDVTLVFRSGGGDGGLDCVTPHSWVSKTTKAKALQECASSLDVAATWYFIARRVFFVQGCIVGSKVFVAAGGMSIYDRRATASCDWLALDGCCGVVEGRLAFPRSLRCSRMMKQPMIINFVTRICSFTCEYNVLWWSGVG